MGKIKETLQIFHTSALVEYTHAYSRQKELHRQRVAKQIPDSLWLLEHNPVLTTGIRKNQQDNILINPQNQGIKVVETERGGLVTYHGPGQLIGYLFINIENHGHRVKQFVHNLESGFINYLEQQHHITAHQDAAHTGVWIGMQKITAIGIALRQRVTMHGFAFNVNTDLSHFNWIVPCGISDADRGVTSLGELLGETLDMGVVAQNLAKPISEALGYQDFTYHTEPGG